MKFFLEIIFLVVIFLLLRKALKAMFPSSKITIKLNPESRQELRKFHRRYMLLFLGLGFLFSAVGILIFRYAFDFLHSRGNYDITYAIDSSSLLLPAAVFGFLMANFTADKINEWLQKDGLSFFLRELQEDWEGLNIARLKKWHILLVIVFGALLVWNQYQVYFKVKGDTIYYSQRTMQEVETKKSDIKKVLDKNQVYLIFESQDTVNLGQFNYDRSEMLDYLKQ